MKAPVINFDNKSAGDIELDDEIFGMPMRRDLLSRAINWQLAKRQAGTHAAKERWEVSGTKKKPFKQKGTGGARQGTLRAPQMRGGGIVFGPRPHSHAFSLPKKVRKLALRTALSAKQADGKLIIVDGASLNEPKTGTLAKQLGKLGWGTTLVIDGATVNENFARAARNIHGLDVLPQIGANVYDILRRDTLVLTKDAVQQLQERLK
jgi:large subunit ribosomal protein L4